MNISSIKQFGNFYQLDTYFNTNKLLNEIEDEEDFYGDDEDDEMEESSHDKTYDPITKKWYQ